jgi:hypothetical protein
VGFAQLRLDALRCSEQTHLRLRAGGVCDRQRARAPEDAQRGLRLAIAHLATGGRGDLRRRRRDESVAVREPLQRIVHGRNGLALGQCALDEELVRESIRERVQEDGRGRQPIATGAARLLIVGLKRARHRVMNHEAHVGLVDAHAERVRRHDDPDAPAHEGVLHLGPVLIV